MSTAEQEGVSPNPPTTNKVTAGIVNSPSSPSGRYAEDSSDEEYSFSGVKLAKRGKAALGRKARVAPIPLTTSRMIPGLLLNAEDRVEDPAEEESAEAERVGTMMNKEKARAQQERALEIKPFIPQDDPESRRQRSLFALASGREDLFEKYGTKPLLVRDKQTGVLLPRDQLVTVQAPKVAVDERGQARYEAPEEAQQASGLGSGSKSKVHYQRSIDLVQQIRSSRVLDDMDYY